LSNAEIQQGRRQAVAVVLGQGLLGAIVAIACLAVWGPRAGASALLGAGIGITATSLMALATLRHGEGADPQRVVLSFAIGWLVKAGFTVALLVVALRSPKVEPLPLLVAYALTFAGYWFGATRAGGSTQQRTMGRSG
jgi:F0F1-type ATP synthase assembly protein I